MIQIMCTECGGKATLKVTIRAEDGDLLVECNNCGDAKIFKGVKK